MKLIAHRGNINGSNPTDENKPEYIEKAIQKGYDVEVDIRYDILDKKFYLGHDGPQYIITLGWLSKYISKLWIHCKNVEALYEFSFINREYNYFWHQDDDFTLTSKQYIWTYPGKPYTPKSVIVMPELKLKFNRFYELRAYNCFGICSDHVENIKLDCIN